MDKPSGAALPAVVEHVLSELQPAAVLLHGSRAVGRGRADSDWDVCVLVDGLSEPHWQTHQLGDVWLDLDMVPVGTPDTVMADRFGTSLRSAQVLVDNDDRVGAAFVALARRLHRQGRKVPAPTLVEQAAHAHRVARRMAAHTGEADLFFFHLSTFFGLAVRYWFDLEGRWPEPPYEALDSIGAVDPQYASLLSELAGDAGDAAKAQAADGIAGRLRKPSNGTHDLSEAWEKAAAGFTAWARAPMHDSYWRFHRDQFLEIVPGPGRLTVDIGCGEGRLSRDLKALGHTVVGVDASPTMVGNARQADPSIEVHLADAATLPLADSAADLAIAFMSLQDIGDMPGTIREAARVLEPGGRLCLAIVHPLNSAGSFRGEEPDSPFVIAGSYLEPFRYTDEVERDGLAVTLTSDHRPLEAYFEALAAASFLVERLREHPVPDEAIGRPRQRRWQRLPLFLHIRALRR